MSTSELKFVMSKLKVHFTGQELQEMILEADIDGDGQVGGGGLPSFKYSVTQLLLRRSTLTSSTA